LIDLFYLSVLNTSIQERGGKKETLKFIDRFSFARELHLVV